MKRLVSILLSITMLLSTFPFGIVSASEMQTTPDPSTHEHTYEFDCDAVCNECLFVRDVIHTLDDSTCTVCNVEVDTCGDNISWFIQDNVLILTGTGDMYHYDIWYLPYWSEQQTKFTKVVVGEGITSLGTNAFCECANITDVELPSTLNKMWMNAFALCSSLTQITIPSGLTSIDVSAFANCSSMLKYEVDGDNTHFTAKNGVLFSADMTSLWAYPIGSKEEIYTMPDTVTTVEAYAFSQAKNLTSITFSKNLKHIDDEAFHSCIGLTEITLPNGFLSTGGGAFQDCYNLATINLPKNMTRIGPLCFDQTAYYNNLDNWENQRVLYLDNYLLQAREKWDDVNGESGIELSGSYHVKSGITLIADEACDFLYRLTDITLPDSLKYIGEGAFCACDGLTSIDIPTNVTHIGELAFYLSDNLAEVNLPDGLQRIGYSAFEKTPYFSSIVNAENPIGYDNGYIIGTHSSLKEANIREGTVLIAENAFEKAGSSVRSITLPESLRYIGAEAFISTYNVNKIIVPEAVEYIGDYALGYSRHYASDSEGYVYSHLYQFVLSGYSDSVAEKYAKEFDVPFEPIKECEHEFTSSITTPYTCTKDGVCTYLCIHCSASYTEAIPAQHTNIVIDAAVTADCENEGLTEGSHCEACGIVITAQETISASDHDYAVATCTKPRTCNICGKTDGEPLSHDWVDAICTLCGATEPHSHNFVSGACTCGTVEISNSTFPDSNFQAWIISQDYGTDGLLTSEELESVTSINVNSKHIKDLKGIEYFTALKILACNNNQLTSLDVSKNTALTRLACVNNQLTSLDVGGCTALAYLDCGKNELTNLDVNKNTVLTYLHCNHNQLTNLNVSKCTALVDLYCYSNLLTTLDTSKNTVLTSLYCDTNQLTGLDVNKNTALTYLDCHGNQLTSLDVSKNTALTYIFCHKNQLTSLDVSKNTELTYLDCRNNQLTSLDVSKNTELTHLDCRDNQLTSLDVSKNTELTYLDCCNNQLTSLDVSKNTALTNLYCYDNERTIFAAQNRFDLCSLATDGFEISKASNWQGCTVSGNILTATSDTVTYTYDLGNGKTETFILVIDASCTHNWQDATCTKPKTCATCGETEGKSLSHSWEAATCTDPKTCKTCKKTSGKALGHDWGDWEVTTKPTTSKSGRETRECERNGCDYSETRSIGKKPAAPTLTVSGNSSSGKPVLKWDAVTSAMEYQVYRKVGKDGSYKKMTTVTGTTYTDKSAEAGKTYYYKIRAVSETGITSDYSSEKARTCDLPQPKVSVTNVASSGKIKLTWEKVSGATKYEVYRATSKNGTYSKLGSTTNTSYTNTGASAGKTYYYKVKAIHSTSAANSAYSAVVSRTCDLARPDVMVKLSSRNVKLTWDKISGATKYEVYRATSKDGTYKLVKTTSSASYTDKDVKSGKTYYYKVKAIHSTSSANSAYSSIDSIKVK